MTRRLWIVALVVGTLCVGCTASRESGAPAAPASAADTTNAVTPPPWPQWFSTLHRALGGTPDEAEIFARQLLLFLSRVDPSLDPGLPGETTLQDVADLLFRRNLEQAAYFAAGQTSFGYEPFTVEGVGPLPIQAAYEDFGLDLAELAQVVDAARVAHLRNSVGELAWQPLASLAMAAGLTNANDGSALDSTRLVQLGAQFTEAEQVVGAPELAYLVALGMELPAGVPSPTDTVAEFVDYVSAWDQPAVRFARQAFLDGNFSRATMGETGYATLGFMDGFTRPPIYEERRINGSDYLCRWTFCWLPESVPQYGAPPVGYDLTCFETGPLVQAVPSDVLAVDDWVCRKA